VDSGKGAKNESDGFGEKDVPQLQGNPAQGRGARDLQQGSAAQAASGLSGGQGCSGGLQKQAFSFKI
jgi:hypothetical protein